VVLLGITIGYSVNIDFQNKQNAFNNLTGFMTGDFMKVGQADPSINVNMGNMNQPFYRPTVSDSFTQLTHSDKTFHWAIGAGGTTSPWNTSGTIWNTSNNTPACTPLKTHFQNSNNIATFGWLGAMNTSDSNLNGLAISHEYQLKKENSFIICKRLLPKTGG
jgi:hypothetical protein